MDFDKVSHELSIKCKAGSDGRMLYKDPRQILSLLPHITPQTIEYKGKQIYLFENERRPEIIALIDSESGLTENEIYAAIFRARDAVVGVYVREVIGLDKIIPGLVGLLKDNNTKLLNA